jgi:RND family efflux transporter MFP subunit
MIKEESMMRKLHFASFLSLAASIPIVFFLAACRQKQGEKLEAEVREANSVPAIVLSSEAQKIAGIKIETARWQTVPLKIKAVGDISFNQKKFSNISSRVSGRIEEVFAFIGDKVKKDQSLLSIYSPDFLSSQAEFIQAKERLNRAAKGGDEEERRAAASLFDSARKKLLVLDVREKELAELEEARSQKFLLSVRAPFEGSIIESSIVSGDFVEFGQSLFKIADLSFLWVKVNIYEKDLLRVRQGCKASIKVAAYPEEEFKGELALISEVMDEKTRTIEGRIEVPNERGKLRPGMYAEVDLISPLETKALFIPQWAVQTIEDKKVVFVPAGENSFCAKEIKTGLKLNGLIEVVEGLKEGDVFVTEGSFLLKSELLKKTLEVD